MQPHEPVVASYGPGKRPRRPCCSMPAVSMTSAERRVLTEPYLASTAPRMTTARWICGDEGRARVGARSHGGTGRVGASGEVLGSGACHEKEARRRHPEVEALDCHAAHDHDHVDGFVRVEVAVLRALVGHGARLTEYDPAAVAGVVVGLVDPPPAQGRGIST